MKLIPQRLSFRSRAAARVQADREAPLLAAYRHFRPRGGAKIALFVTLIVISFAYGFYFFLTFPYMVVPLSIPLGLLAALVIWSLPPGDYAPVGALTPLFFVFTAALFLWPNYLAVALPGLPWLTLLRVIGLPTALILLVCTSVSEAFRKRVANSLAADRWVTRALVIFIVLQAISIAFSSTKGVSVSKFTVAQTNWTAMFFLSCFVFSFPGMVTRWVWLIWGMAIVLCGIALWENHLGHVPWADHIPSILRIEDPAVQRTLAGAARAATGIHRVAATTTHPLIFAEYLGLVVPFAVHFALQRYPIYARVAAALSIPLLFFVVLLTDSRLGLGASLLSIVAYFLFWAALRWRQTRKSLFAPAIVLSYPLIFAAFMAATFFVGRLRNEVWGNGATQASNDSRMEQWTTGVQRVLHQPFGYGIGRSADVLGFTNGEGTLSIDTYYLSIVLEYGLLGFVVYFGMFLRAIYIGGRAGISQHASGELLLLIPLTISLVNFVVVKSVLSAEANHPMVYMMLGAVMALTARVQQAEEAAKAAPKAP
jgi:hypothetical protein